MVVFRDAHKEKLVLTSRFYEFHESCKSKVAALTSYLPKDKLLSLMNDSVINQLDLQGVKAHPIWKDGIYIGVSLNNETNPLFDLEKAKLGFDKLFAYDLNASTHPNMAAILEHMHQANIGSVGLDEANSYYEKYYCLQRAFKAIDIDVTLYYRLQPTPPHVCGVDIDQDAVIDIAQLTDKFNQEVVKLQHPKLAQMLEVVNDNIPSNDKLIKYNWNLKYEKFRCLKRALEKQGVSSDLMIRRVTTADNMYSVSIDPAQNIDLAKFTIDFQHEVATSKVIYDELLPEHQAAVIAKMRQDPQLANDGPDEYGKTALHYAVEQGNIPVTEHLLKNNFDINAQD